MYSLMQVVFVRKALLLLALTVVLLALPTPASAQESADPCARGRQRPPWSFVAVDFGLWTEFNWRPTEPGCTMNLVFESSDTGIFKFERVFVSSGHVNCTGWTDGRVACTVPGQHGAAWVRVRLVGTGAGHGTLTVHESGSSFIRLWDIFVGPNFLNLAPFTAN